ncbi:hypothetical protein Tco_1200942 [Tanacetum coccineum]
MLQFKNNSKDNTQKSSRSHNEDNQRNLKFTSEDQVRGGLLGIIINRLDLDLFKLAIVLQKAKQIQDFGPTRRIKEMNEGVKDPDQKSLKKRIIEETPKAEDTAKVPAKVLNSEGGRNKNKVEIHIVGVGLGWGLHGKLNRVVILFKEVILSTSNEKRKGKRRRDRKKRWKKRRTKKKSIEERKKERSKRKKRKMRERKERREREKRRGEDEEKTKDERRNEEKREKNQEEEMKEERKKERKRRRKERKGIERKRREEKREKQKE